MDAEEKSNYWNHYTPYRSNCDNLQHYMDANETGENHQCMGSFPDKNQENDTHNPLMSVDDCSFIGIGKTRVVFLVRSRDKNLLPGI